MDIKSLEGLRIMKAFPVSKHMLSMQCVNGVFLDVIANGDDELEVNANKFIKCPECHSWILSKLFDKHICDD